MNKSALSESDVCDKFIRPAMERAGWHGLGQIYREYPLRAGRVVVRGRTARRDATTVLRADYALFYKTNIPTAVVEAKDNNPAMGADMAQAVRYGELLDLVSDWLDRHDTIANADLVRIAGIDTLKASKQQVAWRDQGLLMAVSGRAKRNMAYRRPDGAGGEPSLLSVLGDNNGGKDEK